MFCAMEEQKLGKKSGREGKKGGGGNPRKGRGSGKANVWPDLCAGVKATGGRAVLRAALPSPELSPVTLAGCLLG